VCSMSIKTVVIIALGLGFLYGLFTIGSPFLLALIVAIFIEPVNIMVMKYARLNRLAAATLTSSLFTLLIIGLLYLLGLKVISELIAFFKKFPVYLAQADVYFSQAIRRTELFYETLPPELAGQIQNGLDTGVKALTATLNDLLTNVSGPLLKVIPNLFIFFIVFLVALYLFGYSLNHLKSSFLSLFDEKSRDKVEDVLKNLRNAIFGFLRAQIIISSLTYLVALTGLIILGVDYPLAIAFLIILVDILPILGTGTVLVPWSLYNLLTGDNYLGFGLLVLFLVITVFRRIVEPKILGDSVGIGALSALISLYVGFKLVGVIGLFLGPIVVIVYQAMRKVGLLKIKIRLD
jgi:sporulation integral membrane protein YtvI